MQQIQYRENFLVSIWRFLKSGYRFLSNTIFRKSYLKPIGEEEMTNCQVFKGEGTNLCVISSQVLTVVVQYGVVT